MLVAPAAAARSAAAANKHHFDDVHVSGNLVK